MAIIDAKLDFGTITLDTGGASALIGDVIDLGADGIRDIGTGTPVYLVIAVSTAITVATNGTLGFQLYQGATTTPSESVAQSHIYTEAELETTGYGAVGTILWCQPLPVPGLVYKRYLQIRQLYGTAAVTAGAINAYLTLTPPSWKAAADALTV